jgi:hypothetical protein
MALAAFPLMASAQDIDEGLMAYYLEDYVLALKVLGSLSESDNAEAQNMLGQI